MADSRTTVAVIVEEQLACEIAPELEQYATDLAAQGIRAKRHVVAADTPPAGIRTLLATEVAGGLAGALLVGRVPAPLANKNVIARAGGMLDEAPPSTYWHAHPCDLYYMNIQGRWEDTDGDGVLDRWEGDRRADIWVSRIRADTVAQAYGTREADLVRRYLAKNHAYRTGQLDLPSRRALVAWHTIDVLRSQTEASGWGCSSGLLYGPEVEVYGALGDGLAAAEGYRRLMDDPEGYELGVINCKTMFDYHSFDQGGQFPWDWVRNAEPKRVLWYHMLTSEPGRHDQENYLAGIYLFSCAPTQVLFCGTQHSGVVAAPTLYPDLAAGLTFGGAFRNAVNYEVAHWGEAYFEYTSWAQGPDHRMQWRRGHSLPAAVLHGDGSLRLPGWQNDGRHVPCGHTSFSIPALQLNSAQASVPRWEMSELALHARARYTNPFSEVIVTAVFRAPDSSRSITVEGFHDGDDTWRVRFAPDEEGAWTYEVASEPRDPGLSTAGHVHCVPPTGHGFVRQHRNNPYAFQYSDGTPFFHLGDTCYPLAGLARSSQRLPYLHRRRLQGFSHMRFQVSGSRFGRSPTAWPFGGTPTEPALDRYNPAYFQRLDQLLTDLQAGGLGAEVILLDYYQPPLCTPAWTPVLEEAFLRYVLARLAANRAVIYWTIANEYEVYPDGVYRLDLPGDPEWAIARARLVRSLDPYRGATTVTVHPFNDCARYAGLFAEDCEINPLMVQQHGAEKRLGDLGDHLMDGSGSGLEQELLALRCYGKPVVDSEFGYETNGYSSHGRNITTDLQRRQAWRIFLSGCWASAGFRSTVWNHPTIRWDIENNGGLGQWQMSYLARFFREHLRYWELAPAPGLVNPPNLSATVPGEQYLVYAPEGGPVTVDVRAARGPLVGFWYDPRHGEAGRPFMVSPGAAFETDAPDREDWALLLTTAGPSAVTT